MIKTVIKRDGRQVPFNLAKIATAILKALAQTRDSEQLRGKDDFELEALANKLAEDATRRVTIEAPDIEKIQDAVERTLMEAGYPDTAKSYILYRADRSRARERNTKLMKTLADIVFSSAKESDVKRENANIDGDTAMGSMLKFGSESSKRFYIDNMLRPDIARAHEQGDIHIHDLDFYSLTMTCCQIDLVDLLSRGFSTGHGFLRAPKEIRSFAALACIAIQSNQNDQHGGQSVPNFDLAMAMGVRLTYARRYKAALREAIELLCDPETAADIILPEPPTMGQASDPEIRAKEAEALKAAGIPEEKIPHIQDFARAHALKETDRETYQAMEALIHNLNSMHSRAGAQTPFSSINYGTDTTPEGRMVIKNVLLATQAGLGDGETPIFPIQIFRVKKGVSFDEGDPNYDLFQLACQVSAKRLFPNFAFQDAPFNAALYKEGHPETEISYMGCRTRVATNVYDPSKSQVWKRGNLSFTSINLPRLAIQSHGNIKTFYAQLDDMLQLVRDQLLERFEVQARKRVRNFPFLMGEGVWLDSEKLGPDDEVREVIKHGSLTFGFIGLASIGPILAVVLLGLLSPENQAQAEAAATEAGEKLSLAAMFFGRVPTVLHEVSMALAPLVAMFIVFQLFLIKMPRKQLIRMSVGLVYTFIGLVFFFVGVQGGFMPAGNILGASLAAFGHKWIFMVVGLVLGAVVVCAEPAVWVLNEQIEEVSGGHIKRNIMLVSLCCGVAIAVCLSMMRVIYGISLWWLLVPGYVLALGLTRFCPNMFTAIAFDSGGVASGPMASTFILAFTLGASSALGGNPIKDAFGVIAMIAMMPLITIQILGILFHRKEQRLLLERRERSRAARREKNNGEQ